MGSMCIVSDICVFVCVCVLGGGPERLVMMYCLFQSFGVSIWLCDSQCVVLYVLFVVPCVLPFGATSSPLKRGRRWPVGGRDGSCGPCWAFVCLEHSSQSVQDGEGGLSVFSYVVDGFGALHTVKNRDWF